MNIQNPKSLSLNEVSISLDGKELLSVNAEIKQGQVLSIMGPSGSGKSSLLSFVAGFLDPAFTATGEVCLNGNVLNELAACDRRVGMLFQDPLLFPHMSVCKNLEFAISKKVSKNEKQDLVADALNAAGLKDYRDRDPATLSGGQKSRIALMRVLLSKPRVLLLDEPFSKLDTKLRDQIRAFVFDAAAEQNLPVLMVTHDMDDVVAAKGEVIEL